MAVTDTATGDLKVALELVAVADAAAGDFEVMQRAGRARGDDRVVMARDFKVRAVAAAGALAGGLVADLGVFGD